MIVFGVHAEAPCRKRPISAPSRAKGSTKRQACRKSGLVDFCDFDGSEAPGGEQALEHTAEQEADTASLGQALIELFRHVFGRG